MVRKCPKARFNSLRRLKGGLKKKRRARACPIKCVSDRDNSVKGRVIMAIKQEIIEELLQDYKNQEDLLGEDGLF